MKSASLPPSLHARLFVNIKRRIGFIYKRKVPEFSMTSLVRSKPNLTCMPQSLSLGSSFENFLMKFAPEATNPRTSSLLLGKVRVVPALPCCNSQCIPFLSRLMDLSLLKSRLIPDASYSPRSPLQIGYFEVLNTQYLSVLGTAKVTIHPVLAIGLEMGVERYHLVGISRVCWLRHSQQRRRHNLKRDEYVFQ